MLTLPSFTAAPLPATLRAAGQTPPAQSCRVAATVLASTDALIAAAQARQDVATAREVVSAGAVCRPAGG